MNNFVPFVPVVVPLPVAPAVTDVQIFQTCLNCGKKDVPIVEYRQHMMVCPGVIAARERARRWLSTDQEIADQAALI